MQSLVGDLVNVEAATLARRVSEARRQVLNANATVGEHRELEYHPPRGARPGDVDLYTVRQARTRVMVLVALASLSKRDAFALVTGAGGKQVIARSRVTLHIGVKEGVVKVDRRGSPSALGWGDGSALVVRGKK